MFWDAASGCLVRDVDGNVFLDLSAAFGAAAVGHSHPRVVQAIQDQSTKLIHGMGDVHPPAIKVKLAHRLADLTPGRLRQVILGCNGSDAVEAALKTAQLATGRPGVIAFEGAYHGLSYGALNVTSRDDFRLPFLDQIGQFGHHVPYPASGSDITADVSLDRVELALTRSQRPVGAVIVEPIQGRGGIIVPPPGWFTQLAELTRRHGALLIADEIFTGCGRTGPMFASETTPDLLCVGKAMGGGFPISACIGTPEVMAAWGESRGEAIHTSTYLGHPLGCAAALATLDVIEKEQLLGRVRSAGERLTAGLVTAKESNPLIGEIRGKGLMIGIELIRSDGSPANGAGAPIMLELLRRGIIVLPAGPAGNVIELIPPYIISNEQIDYAVAALAEAIGSWSAGQACQSTPA